MQFAHARDDELASIFVGKTTEGGVFLGQPLQALSHFFAVSLGFWLDGHRDDRFGERRRLQHDLEILIAQGVAGGDVPQTHQRGDIAGKGRFDINAFIGLDHHHPAHALPFAGAWIVDDIALFDLTAVNSEENQLAHVGVSPQLEGQRAELAVVIGQDFGFFIGSRDNAQGRRHVQRRRQIVHDGIKQGLHPALLKS